MSKQAKQESSSTVGSSRLLTGLAGVALVLGIVIAVNVLVQPLRARLDLTEEQLYTLSDGTREILESLEHPVTLKFYFSESEEGVPVGLKNYARRIEDLLGEYDVRGGSDLVVETYDPKPDSDEEQWAGRYGLSAQSMGMMGGPSLYIGLVAVSGPREAAIPFMAPGMEPQLEYRITQLIDEVADAEKPVIGVLSSLPVMGMPAAPMMMQRGPEPWVVIQELQRLYDVRQVQPGSDAIPEEIDTLLVVHPKNLSDRNVYALDQFVMRGGRMIAFVDPLCMSDEAGAQGGMMGGMGNNSSELSALLDPWGLRMPARQVAADLRAATQVNFGQGRIGEAPAWLTLLGPGIQNEEVSTSGLEMLMLPFAGTFEGAPVEGLELDVLLETSEETWTVNAFAASSPVNRILEMGEEAGASPLAIRLSGTFPSAFPNGPPEPGEGEEAAPPVTDHQLESQPGAVVVVVADVDLIADSFSVQRGNFFGQTFVQPQNDNLNFVLNLVEQTAGNEALIGLRSRGTFSRPFDRVQELQRQAQRRWQEEERQLQTRLEEAQARLQELQAAKSDDQQFIISPEQQAEVETFREERFEVQQRLKEVRKNLRRDIEALGWKVKILNIGVVPAAVAVFGVVYGVKRRRRTRL